MISKRLKDFLDSRNIPYEVVTHPTAYTAQEIAAQAHIPGKILAKTVMVKANDQMAMAVLPSSELVDFELLREVTGAERVEMATEAEFKERFPDCETGAMPPFGNLYDLPVYISEDLTENQEIAFNAGTHHEVIRMSYWDFADLVKPIVVSIAR